MSYKGWYEYDMTRMSMLLLLLWNLIAAEQLIYNTLAFELLLERQLLELVQEPRGG